MGVAMPLEWPFFVCLAEVLLFVIAALLVVLKYEQNPASGKQADAAAAAASELEDCQLWECCRGNLHPAWLCAFRMVASLFMFFVLLQNAIYGGVAVFVFYTQWSFTILIIYFVIATFVSLQVLAKNSNYTTTSEQTESLLEEEGVPPVLVRMRAGRLGYVMLLIFQVIAPSVFLTDTIYWLILVPFVYGSSYYLTFTSFSMHALNAVFLLGEFFLNTMPFPWFRGAYFILLSAVYVVFQWIIHATGLVKLWPYPFLDVSTSWAPVWYIGLGMFHLFIYLICLAIAKAKKPLTSWCFGS